MIFNMPILSSIPEDLLLYCPPHMAEVSGHTEDLRIKYYNTCKAFNTVSLCWSTFSLLSEKILGISPTSLILNLGTWPKSKALHWSLLNFILLVPAHCSMLLKPFWILILSSRVLAIPPSLASSEDLRSLPSILIQSIDKNVRRAWYSLGGIYWATIKMIHVKILYIHKK